MNEHTFPEVQRLEETRKLEMSMFNIPKIRSQVKFYDIWMVRQNLLSRLPKTQTTMLILPKDLMIEITFVNDPGRVEAPIMKLFAYVNVRVITPSRQNIFIMPPACTGSTS